MGRTVNDSILEMLQAIYNELKNIKKQISPNKDIKQLKEEIRNLEKRVEILEIYKSTLPITKPFSYPPDVWYTQQDPTPWLPKVMGSESGTVEQDPSTITSSSFKLDENGCVKLPSISKEFVSKKKSSKDK